MITIVSSASARPNFVKLAAVHHALRGRKDMRHVIVHTGQHYDPLLSDVFFQQLDIDTPYKNLGVRGGGTRHAVIQATAEAFFPVLSEVKPDVVLVYGDVNGAVGAARATTALQTEQKSSVKIGHVEAGLRSGDRDMPEELNRIEIDQLADLLFTTEKSAEDNIKKEKLKGTIYPVGNTMIDTLNRLDQYIERGGAQLKKQLPQPPDGRFALVTLHRPSNVDHPDVLKTIMTFLQDIASRADCPLVLPVHPRLQDGLRASRFVHDETIPLRLVDPMGYVEFLTWMKSAAFVLTDSGGIQEEAAYLKKRCFTMRRNTERPATIECGSNRLIDPTSREDRAIVLAFAKHPETIVVNDIPLWDGKAGERIADTILAAVSS